MRRDVFQAIADPNRRAIIHMLTAEPMTHTEVARHFDISRPAISKHLRILQECGLIEIEKEGREKYCRARLQSLHEVSDWVEQYRTFWTNKLDALGDFLAKGTGTKSSNNTPEKTGKNEKRTRRGGADL